VPRSDDDDQDFGEVAILRGGAARRFLEGVAGGDDEGDEGDEWTDEDGVTWIPKPKRTPRKATGTTKKAGAKRGFFDSLK
jgi:hypothetical protein